MQAGAQFQTQKHCKSTIVYIRHGRMQQNSVVNFLPFGMPEISFPSLSLPVGKFLAFPKFVRLAG